MKKVIYIGKRSKTLNEAKPAKNINKNPQKSFLHINCKTIHMYNSTLSV